MRFAGGLKGVNVNAKPVTICKKLAAVALAQHSKFQFTNESDPGSLQTDQALDTGYWSYLHKLYEGAMVRGFCFMVCQGGQVQLSLTSNLLCRTLSL